MIMQDSRNGSAAKLALASAILCLILTGCSNRVSPQRLQEGWDSICWVPRMTQVDGITEDEAHRRFRAMTPEQQAYRAETAFCQMDMNRPPSTQMHR